MKAGLKKISGVISMTNRLAESLAKSRPSLILPSIQNVSFYMPKRAYKNTNDGVSKNRIITIVYAGGLYKDSGVDLLAESFCRANWNDKRLIIAGSGILENTIRAYSKKNARISFLGFLDANKLIELYAQADILINPRRISSSIALLSFPSKIVEYLCTGKPVISTNMPSLTAEFRKQLILVYSEEPEELIQCIDRVASWDSRKRNQWRISTIQFIKRELSPDVQGSRIKEFVQGL
jgi:glycosyltransferase involved in cell wall biosynthesis